MQPVLSIVPRPQSVRMGEGRLVLGPGTAIRGEASGSARAVLERVAFARLAASGPAETAVDLRIDPALSALGDEGYRLVVSRRGVTAASAGRAGLHHALVTLGQLLSAEAEGRYAAPCVEVEDRPRLSWRGAMLDVSRHFMPKTFIHRFIDLLELHKLNTLHWHLTDDQGWRLEIGKYPRLTEVGAWRSETLVGRYDRSAGNAVHDGKRHGGFYTQAEVREIVSYAAERSVRIVPEIEMPGHARAAVASYPELGNTDRKVEVARGWGIHEHVFNVEERTLGFLTDVLDEVMELFPGPFVHIGGDECPKTEWKQSAAARARMRELGLASEEELQSYLVRRMDRHLAGRGRRLVGWDEILEGGLAEGATVMSWRGEEGGIAAAKAGHDVVMTPTHSTYLDYCQSRDTDHEPLAIGGYLPLEKVYAYEPVPAALPPDRTHHVLGTQGQLWTEYMATPDQVEYMAFPRLCALAETAWLEPARKSYPDFLARLEGHLGRLDRLGVRYRPLDAAR